MLSPNRKLKNRLLSLLGYTLGCCFVGIVSAIPIAFFSCLLTIYYRLYLCDIGLNCDDVGDFVVTYSIVILAFILPIAIGGIIGIFVGIWIYTKFGN